MKGYWNGENATFKGVTYEVTEVKEHKTWWQNQFIGHRRQGLEITHRGKTFFIDNENGDGYEKVVRGMGYPNFIHKTICNPVNIEYIKDIDINTTIDLYAQNKERHANREWSKSVDPELFGTREDLRNKLLSKLNIVKEILFDELIEQSHPVLVETVIYEALSDYHKKEKNKQTYYGSIAYSICTRIDEAKAKGSSEPLMNPELVRSLLN